MTMLEQIIEQYPEEKFMKADGFDDAIIGVEEKTMRLIYSVEKCLKTFVERDKMTIDEAMEMFEYNVKGSYMGEKTPIWCEDNFLNI